LDFLALFSAAFLAFLLSFEDSDDALAGDALVVGVGGFDGESYALRLPWLLAEMGASTTGDREVEATGCDMGATEECTLIKSEAPSPC
jgi:hypothetical protein